MAQLSVLAQEPSHRTLKRLLRVSIMSFLARATVWLVDRRSHGSKATPFVSLLGMNISILLTRREQFICIDMMTSLCFGRWGFTVKQALILRLLFQTSDRIPRGNDLPVNVCFKGKVERSSAVVDQTLQDRRGKAFQKE